MLCSLFGKSRNAWYDNLIAFEQITRAEQVWVSDITYLRLNNSFVYLSLITDAYSRQIMGYHLQNDFSAEGCLRALRMAIVKRKTPKLALTGAPSIAAKRMLMSLMMKL